ncbi:MAG: hypothetical protein WBH03_15275, partial [Cyclobacteriaceae bacterium]
GVFGYMDDLYQIKWEEPEIPIPREKDMLTPLLMLQYLGVLRTIVRKGLRKGYAKKESNLRSKVKGKVLVGRNIRQNLARSRPTHTWCAYDEFTTDIPENRVLRKALSYVQRHLPTFPHLAQGSGFTDLIHYISPAFAHISEDVSLQECRHFRPNPLYKEYATAIDLAQKILRRLGHNARSATDRAYTTPPFWIDMSKLFELYVLQKLKARYPGKVAYQFGTQLGIADFILCDGDNSMVIDAKYKLKYREGNFDNSDLWQVSGYARTDEVYKKLGKPDRELIDCLIIHPADKDGDLDKLTEKPISTIRRVYQLGVELPVTG